MNKKILSLLIAAVMLFGIVPAYAIDVSELTILEQSFAGLSDIPEGWTVVGNDYDLRDDSIASTSYKYVKVYCDDAFDTNGGAYKVTFNIAHYNNKPVFVHIGTDATGAVSETVASKGYSISFNTSNWKKAVIKLYKDGEELGTIADGASDYAYQSLRKFEFLVSDTAVTLSGAGKALTVENTEPIYSGYIGFALKDANGSKMAKLSYVKINKLLEVSGSNVSDTHGIADDIEIDFNYPLEASTVNQTNIYVVDEDGNALSKEYYNVSNDGSKVTISFNINLEYSKNYSVVIGTGLYIEGTTIGMASERKIPFTTEGPPFYVKPTAVGNTLNIEIGNDIYEPQDFKIFVKATNESGDVIGNYVYSASMPTIGDTIEFSETVAEDLTDAQIEVYTVASDNTPLLDDFFKLDAKNNVTVAEIYANRLTDDAKTAVSQAMSANEYTDIDTLYIDFAKNVVAASINGWSEDGYNHIEDVFEVNGTFIGLELGLYNEAVDKSAMNEYIYNYGVNSFEDIQSAVDAAIIETDRAYYTHTFSTADAQESDWNFYVKGKLDNTLTENSDGVVFSDNSGISFPKVTRAKIISKFDVSGNYELSGTFKRNYNHFHYYFSYIDSSNWCRVVLSSVTNNTVKKTTIERCVYGTTTTYATYGDDAVNASTYIVGAKVIVEEDGYVTVKNDSDEILIDRTYVGGPLEKAKIGFEMYDGIGYIKTVNVLTYLKGTADASGNDVPIETDKVNVTFNYNINPKTATKDNIKVYENGKVLTNYSIDAKTDGTGFDVLFGDTLKYKSKYDIAISENVKVAFGKSRLLREQIISFVSEKPSFNVKSFYGKSGETDVFVNEMSTVNEVYIASAKLTDFADTDITVTLEAENSATSEDTALVVIELADENGKPVYNSGLIPVTVAGGGNYTVNKIVHIPADITEGSKFSYFVFDNETNLHTKYPFIDVQPIGAGELPELSKVGNEVKIWGSTVSKTADKNINLVLKSEQNGEVIKTASVNTDANGNYNFEFELNTDLLAQSDYVNVSLSGEEYQKALSQKIYVAIPGDRNDAVEDINDRADTKQAIEDNAHILDIKSANKYGVKLYENLSETELTKLASLIDSGKPYSETDNGEQFVKKAQEFMAIIHYNSGNSNLLYSSDGEMLTSDIIDFSKLAATGDTYKIYNENLKEAGKIAVRNGILNKNCNTVEDLGKAFAQSVIAYGVNNWHLNGYGHIYNLLTQNASVSGLDITKYVNMQNRTAFEQSLLNNPVSDFADLQSRINNISEGSLPGAGGSIGGGAGGAGGGASGGGNPGASGSFKDGFGQASANMAGGVGKGFSDLGRYEWAKDAVTYLNKKNIVSGYDDNTFRPENAITREEFITLIVRAFGLTSGSQNTEKFKDVSEDAWYVQYVKAAQSNKIVEGYDGIFGVGKPLTRQDAVVILDRVLSVKGYAIDNDKDSVSGYNDANKIADYAYEAFNKFVGNGVINGVGDNTLAPNANCKRAEMAVMLYNVLMRYN